MGERKEKMPLKKKKIFKKQPTKESQKPLTEISYNS